MSNISIFENKTALATRVKRESKMSKVFENNGLNMRRIATSTNGTFKRVVNGEQIGKAIRGEFNCIIVDALAGVSRTYYEGKYDPNAKPTLPDCWSNLGDKPEPSASNKQGKNCNDCRMNVKGSGGNGGKACRYERRLAILLEGDPSGDIYQLKVPSMSLFDKGSSNLYGFEAYTKYLASNSEATDTVVTKVSYDPEADTMKLVFSVDRFVTDEEWELIQRVQDSGDTERYTKLTVAAVDGAKPKAKPVEQDEDEEEEEEAPKPKATKAAAKPASNPWDDDEEEEEEEAPAPKAASKPANKWDDEEEETEAEPVKRKAKAKEEISPAAKSKLAEVVGAWGDDDEDEA